ncbi:MAG: pyruvate dehydrogenase (acetyl-transferring) E1 component subunit alpha, partial [Bacteroidetes bacterium]|nr:pyruvate dehydrogenase (acetyl-transferring) E1 component subunit alpha [Bacteroidota bacterium]
YKLGHAYEMPSFSVDGMRCEDVHDGISEACVRARKGDGPTLLEINTYRYKGHSMSDPAKYRTKEEVESYKAQDPIEQVLETIVKKKYATKKEIVKIQKRVTEEVNKAVEFAEESPFPEPEELYEDVYRQENYPFITS